ncbi:MAG: BatA domain-containing protein [Verrucomicrobiota bacterium]|nr:BatA domain-containing protein [Verrucomicrobiota bacterium]
MSFLAPWFLLGALAIGGPILFHLIRRSTRKRFTFSSLMFLSPTPPRVTRKSRLEDLFLLFLRCCMLALLALAFARPFFSKPALADPANSSGRHTLLLLDTSASMQREGLWETALARARAIIDATPSGDNLALHAFDDQTHALLRFDQWRDLPEPERLPAARQRLADQRPGWGGTHLGNALLAASEALEETAPQSLKRIVVITDRQAGSRLAGLQGHEWPGKLQINIETISTAAPGNAGLAPAPAALETDQPRVRVRNSPGAAREQFRLAWLREGQADSTNTAAAYVPAGQVRTLTAPRRPTGPGWRLTLLDDPEPFDNTLHLGSFTPEPVRIHYTGNERDDDQTQMRYFLERAFQKTRLQHVESLIHPPNGLRGQLTHPADRLLILTEPVLAAQLDDVRAFCRSGRPVLLVLKDDAMAGTLAALAGSGPVPVAEASVDEYALFAQLDFEHPLLAPFNEPRFSDFTKIHFWQHRTLDPARVPGARVLARFDNRASALLDLPLGQGHLFILASGWHPADSQLALSSKFVPLLYSMIEQGRFGSALRQAWFLGEPIALPPPHDQPRAITGPEGRVEIPSKSGAFHASRPGIYTLDGPRPATFAVNLPPAESRTKPLPMELLRGLKLPFAPEGPESEKAVKKREQALMDATAEKRQKLWRWMILAAILLALLETGLAGWLWRRPAKGETAAKAT